MFERIKKYKFFLIGLFLIFLIVKCSHENYEEKIENQVRLESIRSISVLPKGVEENWIIYIKKRFEEEIQREGNSLRVRTNFIGSPPKYSYVSLNHPYEIDCNSYNLGFSVSFSSNDEEDNTYASLTGIFSPDNQNEPERGVPLESVASQNLDAEICRYVSKLMENIILQKNQDLP